MKVSTFSGQQDPGKLLWEDGSRSKGLSKSGSAPPPWSIGHWAMGAKEAVVASRALSSL